MRKGSVIFLILITFCLFYSCEYRDIEHEKPVVTEELSFSKDIEPIFKIQSCTNCHKETLQPDLTAGKAYNSLITNYIDTLNPSGSLIYSIPETGGNHPAKYTILQSAQILTWIDQGAKNN